MIVMKKTIPDLFIKSAEEHEDNIAFNYFDKEWKKITYKELLRNSKAIASYLIKNGIQKGDRVAIYSENRPEWGTAYLSLSLAGGIGVPIDVQLGPEEIRILIVDSEAKAIFHSSKTEDNVRNALNQLKDKNVLLINFDTVEFNEILKTSNIEKYPEVFEDDLASIIYTSGTTGMPKGVMLTHSNFCSDADALLKAGLLSSDDSVISVLPLHHTYPFMGNCILPIFLGITVTFPQSLKGQDLMTAIREFGITILVSVPQLLELIRNGIFNKLKQLHWPLPMIIYIILKVCSVLRQNLDINLGKFIFKSVHKALGEKFRFFACGGAKLDPHVMKDLEALGLTVLEGYGLTETSPVVTFNPIKNRKPGSVGIPLPSAEIKIVEPESRQEIGIKQEGEIVISGPMVMKGYYKNREATEQVLKNGWFYSGDLGYRDHEGYLFITGRLKEVIVLSSGKNIYPDEVEKRYLSIPMIKEICVLGMEERGKVDSLHAVIVPDFEYARKAQIGNIYESLKWEINSVSQKLPVFMRVKGFTLSSEPLPRTPLGKLRRFMVKNLIRVKGEKLRVKSEDKDLIHDEVSRKVVECIRLLLKEKVYIQSSDNLELDLGLDSLNRIELIASLEKVFSLKLSDTFASEVQTVGELVEKIKEYGGHKISEKEEIPRWKDMLITEPDIKERRKIGLYHGFVERIIMLILFFILKIVMKIFFRVSLEGEENLPDNSPYIIAPNHASYLDAFSIAATLSFKTASNLYSLGVEKYFAGNLKEIIARILNVIPIDPETYLAKALEMSAYVLRNGKSLMIFPEGGRSYDGELMEFKKGVGILSKELNVPVIPTFIKGSFEALPRGARWPNFSQIKIILGKPLSPADIDFSKKPQGMDEYQFLVNELRERIKALKDKDRKKS